VTADNCLRIFVLLTLARTEQAAAWHLVTALLMLPAVVLSPVNGALGNSLPKRWVLTGSAAYCFGVVLLFTAVGDSWLGCWALVAVGNAVYSPTRYALLPAAATDTRIPLVRVNGWIEMGAGAAVVVGMILGGDFFLFGTDWPALGNDLGWLPGYTGWAQGLRRLGVPVAAGVSLALNLVGWVAAVPVWFRSDVRRPESAGQAVAGFFRDMGRVWGNREVRAFLLAMAGFRGLVAAMAGVLIAPTVTRDLGNVTPESIRGLLWLGAWIAAGVALGSLLAGVQGHPRRAIGLAPFGAACLLAGLLLLAVGCAPSPALCVFLGASAGLVNVPLSAAYQAGVPVDARGNGMAVRNLADYVSMAVLATLLYVLAHFRILSVGQQFWLVAVLAGLGCTAIWWVFLCQALEQLTEWAIWPIYRIRGHGPGLPLFPAQGPVLVVANHSAWFDPLYLAKVLPRRLIMMMTSQFYDLPGLRHVFRLVQAIRVQVSAYRRDVPELAEAIAALDRGEGVVIFPEGAMRRREVRPLKLFGQGVWHILHERPNTPVVVCWIEGGWGSYTSYWKGRPTVNKRFDFWRRIDVAVSEPQILDKFLLQDQWATRTCLMHACLEARRLLGLEPLRLDKLAEEDKENGEAKE
jgi:1-acyl-sn-glycerol-3-phosphate acyltransferase